MLSFTWYKSGIAYTNTERLRTERFSEILTAVGACWFYFRVFKKCEKNWSFPIYEKFSGDGWTRLRLRTPHRKQAKISALKRTLSIEFVGAVGSG